MCHAKQDCKSWMKFLTIAAFDNYKLSHVFSPENARFELENQF